MWITGLETVSRNIGISRVIALSATPFFLRGSGYAEGTLFPWTMSDFSLMDAIECGIVKLPRVPVADNIPGEEMPRFRNLWENIGTRMPTKGRGKSRTLDPPSLHPLSCVFGNPWQLSGVYRVKLPAGSFQGKSRKPEHNSGRLCAVGRILAGSREPAGSSLWIVGVPCYHTVDYYIPLAPFSAWQP